MCLDFIIVMIKKSKTLFFVMCVFCKKAYYQCAYLTFPEATSSLVLEQYRTA